MPGASDEGFALFVFICSRAFAHEHQVSFRIADSEDDLLASLGMKFAARAIADVFANEAESGDGVFQIFGE